MHHVPGPRPPPGAPVAGPRAGRSGPDRSLPDNEAMLLALIAHSLPILTSALGPLVLWALKREQSSFTAYHAAQAFWWAVATLALMTLSCGLATPLLPLFWIYGVYVGLRAREGEWTGYPLLSGLGNDRRLI